MQHDFDITTADANTGATMRTQINSALQALASNSSASTEPGIKYPFMWWADNANDILKQRNAANTAWINVLKMSTGVAYTAAACSGNAATATNASQLGGVAASSYMTRNTLNFVWDPVLLAANGETSTTISWAEALTSDFYIVQTNINATFLTSIFTAAYCMVNGSVLIKIRNLMPSSTLDIPSITMSLLRIPS